MKLNLACGLDIKDGWINLDVIPRWPGAPRACEHVWDARDATLPFPDGSAEEIYAGYLLLHLPIGYHRAVLAEIHRVLAPNGVLRVGEVEMREVMKRWLDNQADESAGTLIWGEQGLYRGATLGEYDKHCRGFTRQSLAQALFDAGFVDLREVKVHGPDVYYELTIECRKGNAPEPPPFVSIIMPTMRVGGLDVSFEALRHQTHKRFELILVDGLHSRRSRLVEQARRTYPFDVVHVPPQNNPFPLNAYCRYVNTGLRLARGPVVIFMSDYSWPDPLCVESHASFHAKHKGEKFMLAQPYGISYPLPTKPNLPTYGPGDLSVEQDHDEHYRRMDAHSHNYERDINSGALDEFMWTIFPKTPTLEEIATNIWQLSKPGRIPEGPVDDPECNLRNESFPLDALLEVNGLDEDLDGAHGWQDSELSDRLKTRLGMRWWSRQAGALWMCKPYNSLNVRRLRDASDPRRNEKIWKEKKARAFSGTTNPEFDLTKDRQQSLSASAPTNPTTMYINPPKNPVDSLRDCIIVEFPWHRRSSYKAFVRPEREHQTHWSFIDEAAVKDILWHIRPGDVVFDVGAAYGSYTMPALLSTGTHVYAFAPENYAPHLRENLRLNGWEDRCTICPEGLWEKPGYLWPTDLEKPIYSEHQVDDRYFKVNTLDNYVAALGDKIKSLDILKIDTEGAEVHILRGAKHVIKTFKPTVIVEIHLFKDQTLLTKTNEIMAELNYAPVATVDTLPGHHIHVLYKSSERTAP